MVLTRCYEFLTSGMLTSLRGRAGNNARRFGRCSDGQRRSSKQAEPESAPTAEGSSFHAEFSGPSSASPAPGPHAFSHHPWDYLQKKFPLTLPKGQLVWNPFNFLPALYKVIQGILVAKQTKKKSQILLLLFPQMALGCIC